MADFITILMVLGELVTIVLITLALILSFIVWKDNKNQIDLVTFFLFLSAAIAIFYSGIRTSLINLGLIDSSMMIKIGLLEIDDFMTILMASFYLWFILFLLNWEKLYSLPLVLGFYVTVYLSMTGNRTFIEFYLIFTILPSMVLLLINAVKNKHGLSFTLAIMAVAAVLIAVVAPATIWSFLIKAFTGINIILGENGWWDDHVFYDRNKRKKIQNVWIARMTTVENN